MDSIKQRFIQRMKKKLSARTHMSLILVATIACGVLVSRVTLYWTEIGPALRYGIAVLFSYGLFFLLMRLWLHIVFGSRREAGAETGIHDSLGPSDLVSPFDFAPQVPSAPSWQGGGGSFSGGGAQASWGNSEVAMVKDPSTDSSDLDLDVPDEFGAIIALIVLVVAVIGSATYVVYLAPELMFEAAFEILLAAGLARRARKISTKGWAMPLFRGTWVPVLIVLILSIGFGSWIQVSCPDARSYGEMKQTCLSK